MSTSAMFRIGSSAMGFTERIRGKLALGVIQRAYDTHAMLYWGGVAAPDLCRACDQPLAGDVGVGYRSRSGELHWFHLVCDEMRKILGPQFACRATSPRGQR